jgi:DNA-binding HxlR family transcriptional regulator
LEDDGLTAPQEVMRGGVGYVFYDYTGYGRTLIPVLDALGSWGLIHAAAPSA